jgi:hypothetical protein
VALRPASGESRRVVHLNIRAYPDGYRIELIERG